MKFRIIYGNQPKKFLKKQSNILAKRILDKIDFLIDNPIPQNSKRIEGRTELIFRIRIGDFRILYELDYVLKEIGIIKIDKRSKIYK